MGATSIHEQVQEIFRQVLDDEGLAITPQTSVHDIEEWSSLRHVDLLVALERRFGIRFHLTEISHLHLVGDLEAAVAGKLGSSPDRA